MDDVPYAPADPDGPVVVLVGADPATAAVRGPYDDVRLARRAAYQINAHPDRRPGEVWARVEPTT